MAIMQFKPHCDSIDYRMYISGSTIVSATMFIALLVKVDVSQEDQYSQRVLSGLLIAMHVGMVLAVCVQMSMVGHTGWLERNKSLVHLSFSRPSLEPLKAQGDLPSHLEEHDTENSPQEANLPVQTHGSDKASDFDLWKKTGFDARTSRID